MRNPHVVETQWQNVADAQGEGSISLDHIKVMSHRLPCLQKNPKNGAHLKLWC